MWFNAGGNGLIGYSDGFLQGIAYLVFAAMFTTVVSSWEHHRPRCWAGKTRQGSLSVRCRSP